MVKRADSREERSALAAQILTLTGHPFLTEPALLLGALQPAAGFDFRDDVAAALRWAAKTYGIKPDQLRPSPLPPRPTSN
jgi:hypothetical protein